MDAPELLASQAMSELADKLRGRDDPQHPRGVQRFLAPSTRLTSSKSNLSTCTLRAARVANPSGRKHRSTGGPISTHPWLGLLPCGDAADQPCGPARDTPNRSGSAPVTSQLLRQPSQSPGVRLQLQASPGTARARLGLSDTRHGRSLSAPERGATGPGGGFCAKSACPKPRLLRLFTAAKDPSWEIHRRDGTNARSPIRSIRTY